MNELNGIIRTKGNLTGTVNTNVKTKAAVSVGGTLISSQTSKRGIPGVDGYSPSASVSKVGNKATITITDKDGTTTADIYDGSGASAFIAEYGVTTYADVKDAYDEDAIIICTVDDSGNTAICHLAYYDDANGLFYFAQPQSDGFYLAIIASDDTWDDGYFQFASTDTATQLRDGLMSALDWQKLDGIESGAEVNVQSDWNEADNTKDDFIKNKPTIPSKTSDLNNDSGFITSSSLPSNLSDLNNDMDVSDFPNDAGYITSAHEIPSGGTTGQVLTKDSGTDYDVSWEDPSGGTITDVEVDGTSVVTAGVAEIDLTGKADAAHTHTKSQITDFPSLATVATTGDYDDLTDTPAIHNVPSGGSSGQVLSKASGTDYDLAWVNQSGGGGGVTDVTQNGTSVVTGGVAAVTVPTDTGDLTNGAGFITGMAILSYGSSTWNDFLTAYNANKVVYCRASSNANPGSGTQGRFAFMAYVNFSGSTPTSVEFQYYRSVSSHSDSQQGDQVFVYKLSNDNTWSVTTREAYSKIAAGSGLNSSYSSSTLTLKHSNSITAQKTQALYPIKIDAQGHITAYGTAATIPTNVSELNNDSGYITGYTETDPVFSASAAAGITATDISNWNNGKLSLDTSAQAGTTDGDLYSAIVALGWASDVIE